jgi:prepilin-type N-terminal cleavage/methylation domain-containing protein
MRVMLATGRRTFLRGGPASVSAGFTLIELMVVLAILVMMGTIFPFVLKRALPHERVVMGSQRLRAAIHDAQTLSQGTGEPRMLDAETLAKLLPEGTHLSVTGMDGTALTSLTVYPDGSVTAGRIDVAEGVQHQTVVTNALTGRVRVE